MIVQLVTVVYIDRLHPLPQLLHPLGDKSPIESFLKKKPDGGMHHICIEVASKPLPPVYFIPISLNLIVLKVDDIEKAVKSLEGKVRTLGTEPKVQRRTCVL